MLTQTRAKPGLLRSTAMSAVAAMLLAMPVAVSAQADNEAQVVPNNNVTPTQAIDTARGVNGVGMFFRNDGFVCTGTLINPRTVLFAAHCVNDRPESDYGTTVRSAFSFGVNALPGFQNWIGNNFASNPSQFVYDINAIFYNPASVARPDGLGFLEGDIALASLTAPAANVPTWALLFSALPTPTTIDPVRGTGYHVNITGYGRSGNGTSGAIQGIDWRRRAAENMLGALINFDTRNTFLFGAPFGDLPQVLYSIDFDDPNRTSPFDFNLFKDEALPNEGTTAGGDSGGPLILDAANNPGFGGRDLVIGVLSGGSRFFGPQAFSSYGTQSFYQPLFLFWDYIAATNPYRYVSANAGDGNWEDPTRWVTDLDPAYRVINANGQVVNGIPTALGEGIIGDTPQFGEVCFDQFGDNPGEGCQDLSTGEFTPPSRNAGDGTLSSGIGQVGTDLLALGGEQGDTSIAPTTINIADLGTTSPRGGVEFAIEQAHGNGVDFAVDTPQNHNSNPAPVPLPPATIANGLPGATNFVPDNIDPAPGVAGVRRYFEVTLSRAGTTTLSSARTIDRLNVGGTAGLNVAAAGNLRSLIDINQTGGRVIANGTISSVGDYTLFAGTLSGTGTVRAPFLTSIAGSFAPGTAGTVGTLNIDGNLVMASGTTYFVDLGAAGVNDRLAVTGAANVGGVVAVAYNTPLLNSNPVTYRILTSGGARTGTFSSVGNVSAIIRSSLSYTANAVDLTLQAQSYQNVIVPTNAVQASYARLLDQNRGNAGLASLYATLDFLPTAAGIQATLNGLAPAAETTQRTITRGLLTNVSAFHNDRLSQTSRADNGGTVAVIGQPLQLAQASLATGGIPGIASPILSDAAMAAGESTTTSSGLNENIAVYLAGGFVQGEGAAMPVTGGLLDDEYDGYFIAGGIEFFPSESSVIGGSVYYTDVESDGSLRNSASGQMLAGTIYGRTALGGGVNANGQLTIGTYDAGTRRIVTIGTTTSTLVSSDDVLTFAAEAGLSKDLSLGDVTLTPGVGVRYASANFSTVTETGGAPALTIAREDYDSFQGRAGGTLNFPTDHGVRFNLSADYVHEFADNATAFGANFAGGTGNAVPFALASDDRNWGELGAGIEVGSGNVRVGVSANVTVGRTDASSQVYQGRISVRF